MQLAVSLDRAAEAMDVSRSSIERAIKRGELHAVKLGRRTLIPLSSLERLFECRGDARA